MDKPKKAKAIVAVSLSVLVLIVILQNTHSVETKLLFITLSMPRAFLLFLTFLFGFIAGAVSAMKWSKS